MNGSHAIALRKAAGRQADINRAHGLILVLTLTASAVVISVRWNIPEGGSVESSDRLTWDDFLASRRPIHDLNTVIDRLIATVQELQT